MKRSKAIDRFMKYYDSYEFRIEESYMDGSLELIFRGYYYDQAEVKKLIKFLKLASKLLKGQKNGK